MKITLNSLLHAIKTKSEPSSIVSGLWIARSVIGVNVHNKIQPIFGFGAAFNQEKSEMSSRYELLEHLTFLPYLYGEKSYTKPIKYISDDSKLKPNHQISKYFIGSAGPRGIFTGNGCAIASDANSAIMHSKHELIERHLCCEIWYKHSQHLLESEFKVDLLTSPTKLKFYTTDAIHEGIFVLSVLEDEEENFFALGAAIRSNREEAHEHALGEVSMIFEDVKKRRSGISSTERAMLQILSLRNKEKSNERKTYFNSLILKKSSKLYIPPLCETIVFEPCPDFFAARTFSATALDPREFEAYDNIPILPLF